MTEYNPDNWVIIKITNEGKTFYKVLAGWSGGYLDGDSWKLNSGITKVEEDGDNDYLFHGYSGSSYRCHKNVYQLRTNNAYIWDSLKKQYPNNVELMDENTDWLTVDWNK